MAEGHSGGLLNVWKKYCFQASFAFPGQGFLCIEGKWNDGSELVSIIDVYAPQEDREKENYGWISALFYPPHPNCFSLWEILMLLEVRMRG